MTRFGPAAVLLAALLMPAGADGRIVEVGEPGPRLAHSALSVTVGESGAVRAGAPARLEVRVRDRGLPGARSRRLHVAVRLGRGLQARSAGGRRWSCSRAEGSLVGCRYRGSLARGQRTPPLRLRVRGAAGQVGRRVRVTARAHARRGWRVDDTGLARIRIRPALRVRAVSELPSIGDRMGPATGDPGRPAVGTLRADVEGAAGERVRLRWRLLGRRAVRWAHGSSARSTRPRFVVPDVDRERVLRFRVTATDGKATARSTVGVRVVDAGPPPQIGEYRPRQRRNRLTLAVADRRRRVTGGRFVTLAARASGDAPLVTRWRQLSGPDAGTGPVTGAAISFRAPRRDARMRFAVTATDGNGRRLRRTTTLVVTAPRGALRGGFGGGGDTDCSDDPFNCDDPDPGPDEPPEDPTLQLGQCQIDVDSDYADCAIMDGVHGTFNVGENLTGAITVSMAGVRPLVFKVDVPLPASLTDYTVDLPPTSWEPVADRTLEFGSITGRLVQQAGSLSFTAGDSLATFAPYGTDDVSLSGAVLALEGNCLATGAGSCQGAAAGTFRGGVTASPSPGLSSQVSTPFESTLGAGTPTGVATFPASDRLASDTTLHDMSVDVGFGGGSPSGVEVVVNGLADVSEWSDRPFATAYSADGRVLQAGLGEVISGVPLGLFLSDHDAEDVEPEPFTGVGEPVSLIGSRPTIGSTFVLPTAPLEPLGVPVGGDKLTALGTFSPINGSFSLEVDGIEPPGSVHTIFDEDGLSLTVGTLGVTLWREKGGELQLQISGPLTFGTPAGDLEMILAGSATLPGGLLTASATLPEGDTWSNALGIPGVQVSDLAVSMSQSETGMLYGFAGTATMPAWAQTVLGFSSDAWYILGGQMGDGAPCMFFDVEPGPSGDDALDLLNLNVAHARSASFAWAPDPDGCVVGTYEYRSGYSFAADPVVFGESVAVNALVKLSGGGVDSVDATGALSDLDLGALAVDNAAVEATFDKLLGLGDLSISGDVAMLGASTAHVRGSVKADARGTNTLSLQGSYAPPPIGALRLPSGGLKISGTGTLKGLSDLSGTLATSVSVLGLDTGKESLTVSWSNGALGGFSVGVPPINLSLGGADLVGDAAINYDAGTRELGGTFTGTVKLPKLPVFSVTGTLDDDLTGLELDTGTLSATAELDTAVSQLRTTMNARLHGVIGPAGTTITANGSATVEGRVKLKSFVNEVVGTAVGTQCGLVDSAGSAARALPGTTAPIAHAASIGDWFSSTGDEIGSWVSSIDDLVSGAISSIATASGLDMSTQDLVDFRVFANGPFGGGPDCGYIRTQVAKWEGWHTVGTGEVTFESPDTLSVTVDGETLSTTL